MAAPYRNQKLQRDKRPRAKSDVRHNKMCYRGEKLTRLISYKLRKAKNIIWRFVLNITFQ